MSTVSRILQSPWVASARPSTGVALFAMFVVLGVIVVPVTRGFGAPAWLMICTASCVFGIGVLWLLVIPNALWLARDARVLRLPAIARAADASPLIYGLLSVVAPALVLGAIGGHVVFLLTLFLLVAAGCLAYVLLPATVATCLLAAAVAWVNVAPSPLLTGNPRPLLEWAAPAALVLTLMAAWRWIFLLRATSLDGSGWGRPIAWQCRLIS